MIIKPTLLQPGNNAAEDASALAAWFEGPPPSISFEFFPPKTEAMEQALWSAVTQLAPFAPSFVSVTYGAGGSTRERTHATVRRLLTETPLKPAAHLTCVAASREEVDEVARSYWDAGVRHIVALRGDPQTTDGPYIPHPNGYHHASDLVAGLKKIADFEISVAVFPEMHPEYTHLSQDIEALKKKVDAGATRAISQYFFDIEHYLRLRDRAAAAGITIPMVPGIMPIVNFAQARKFSGMCGASVPGWVSALFENLDADPDTRRLVATQVAVMQCRLLRAEGIEHFHFYTLNRAELTAAVCHMLGVRAEKKQAV